MATLESIMAGLSWLADRKIYVGIPDGGGSHGNLSNVELAFLLTNGSPINRNQPRPFLEPAFDQGDVKDAIAEDLKQAALAALEGDFGGAMGGLEMAGMDGETAVKQHMGSGAFPGNAPITVSGGWMRNRVSGKPVHVKGKGSSKPLIDTGALQGAVTHTIE